MAATKDYLELHFIVLLWGFTAILGKLISIPAVELVFYRTLLSAILLGGWLWWRRESFRLGGVRTWQILGAGGMGAQYTFHFGGFCAL